MDLGARLRNFFQNRIAKPVQQEVQQLPQQAVGFGQNLLHGVQQQFKPIQTDFVNIAHQVGNNARNLEQQNPIYGQFNQGIRNATIPLLQNFNPKIGDLQNAYSLPNKSGLPGQIASFVGEQVPFATAMVATGGLSNPVTDKLASFVPKANTLGGSVLSGAAKGAIQNLPYAGLSALPYAPNVQDRVKNVVNAVPTALMLGGGIGGVAGGGQHLYNSAVAKVANVLTKHGLSEEEAIKQAPGVIRNSLGQFTSPKNATSVPAIRTVDTPPAVDMAPTSPLYSPARGKLFNKSTVRSNTLAPHIQGDVNEALGLPREVLPQEGKINFGELLGKKDKTIGQLQEATQSKDLSAYEHAFNKGDMQTLDAIAAKNPGDARFLIHKRLLGDMASQGTAPEAIAPKTIAEQLPPEQSPVQDLNNNMPIGSDNPSSITTKSYMKALAKQQDQARQAPFEGIRQKAGSILGNLKSAIIDSTAPIGDAVTNAEKKGNFQIRPANDVRLQIDRVLRAPTLAGQFAKDKGLVDVLQKSPNLKELDQYLIAKQAADVNQYGKETGRNIEADKQLVKDLAPKHEADAQKVIKYGKDLKQYLVDSGLISKETSTYLDQKYPHYVPLNRIFNELEKPNSAGVSRKGIASLSKQTVVQALKGSTRQIENPTATLLEKTDSAFQQGERNIAAKQLASYKDLPGFEGLIRELKPGETAKNTISYLDNGVKKTFETTPEIEAAAKQLDKQQINIVAKILSVPTRALRLGATGINYPFAISNLVKDQTSAYINSGKSIGTQNPVAFTKGLFAALGHGKLYEDMVRNAGGGTSFDIGRQAPNLTVDKVRSGRNILSSASYTIRHPEELIRTVENIIGRTEELTRAQQYHGTYDTLIREGRTPQDAKLLAAKAARDNTVNFARSGNFSRAMSWVVPYFNAGIQGSRTFMRNVQNRPAATLAKFAIGAGMPVAAATIWNTSDPQRAKAYADIPDFEKQNNIIIIPPNPQQDASGKWEVLKIPLSQEIASLTAAVRRPLEEAAGLDPVKMSEMADALFQTATSINASSPTQIASSFTPQAIKPLVEGVTNKNLFTGRDIVPNAYKNLPADQQVKKNTSGTARLLGNSMGVSPLLVENEANTLLGGVGSQLLNASDNILNANGIIPDNQVGGKSPSTTLQNRFLRATGGDAQQKLDTSLMQGLSPKETQAYDLLHTPRAVDANGNPLQDNPVLNSQQKALLYLNNPKLQAIEQIKAQQDPNHDPIWDLPQEQRNIVFAARSALPNQTNTYKKYLQTQQWYQPFMQQESQFFSSLPNTNTQPTNKPIPTAYVQSQMDAKNWKDPQVKAYLDANTAFNNSQLASIGLPALDAGGFGTGGARKPKKGSIKKNFLGSVKKLKPIAFKATKRNITKSTKPTKVSRQSLTDLSFKKKAKKSIFA